MSSKYEGDVFSRIVGGKASEAAKKHIQEINQKYSLRVTDDFVERYGGLLEFNAENNPFVSDSVVEEIRLSMDITLGEESSGLRHLDTVQALRDAGPREQRFIQAEPQFNKLMQMEIAQGYEETASTLTDMNCLPTERRDYRILNSGICGRAINDDNLSLYEDFRSSQEPELDTYSKLNVLQTFATVRQAIDDNINFTGDDDVFI